MRSSTRLIPLTRHEQFWLDVIRAASRDTDPTPTLWRTQQLRLLFAGDGHADCGGGLAALSGAATEAIGGGSLPDPLPRQIGQSAEGLWLGALAGDGSLPTPTAERLRDLESLAARWKAEADA